MMRNFLTIFGISSCIALAVTGCKPQQAGTVAVSQFPVSMDTAARSQGNSKLPAAARTMIEASRERIRLGEVYDPSYYTMTYPGGDVANDRGVCTDVIIRAYRHLGIDFQKLIHEDMRGNFSSYPRLWGSASTDRNIDHRRVPNIETFLTRKGASHPISQRAADYRAGDWVTWRLGGGLPHIGIVSDRRAPGTERPLILHNIGAGTVEDDILFKYRIAGHFRYFPDGS